MEGWSSDDEDGDLAASLAAGFEQQVGADVVDINAGGEAAG